jgi:hypothetical protein
VTRGTALRGAFLAAIAEPQSWALALAAFLVRGGVILVALPVLVLPTPVGIGNVLAPSLMSVAFGQISVGLIAGTVAIAAGVVGWLCIGGWLAALLEAEAARMIARDEDVVAMSRIGPVRELSEGDGGRVDIALRRGLEAAQILVARLIAYVPLGAALVWGSLRIAVVAYRELTNPLEAGTPVVVRVVRDAPEVIVAVTVAWIVGEIIGSLAARRIALAGDGVFAGLRAALDEVVRRPLATLARCLVPLAVLVAVLVPSLLAAGAAWRTVQAAIGGPDATGLFIAILAFVTLWLIGLLLVAVVSAWRGAVWTVAVVSAPATARRTSDVAVDEARSRRHRGAVPPV